MTALREVDRIEILTLQDNFVDLVARDDTDVVQRAMPLDEWHFKKSVRAEHGFSATVTVTAGDARRTMLFDFGFSADGAAYNADVLGVDLTSVEVMALSHGHADHHIGFEELVKRVGRPGIDLVLHPAALRQTRFTRPMPGIAIQIPSFTRERAAAADVNMVEARDPMPLLGGQVLFLGEVPRTTPFEKGMPSAFYEDNGQEIHDDLIDDTALVMCLAGKGLVVLTGCAHSGIVNTVLHAQNVTGVKDVHAVMGGFHLTGQAMQPVVGPTIESLKNLNPRYVVPTHCTGRESGNAIQAAMPDRYLLNMSGTRMVFAA